MTGFRAAETIARTVVMAALAVSRKAAVAVLVVAGLVAEADAYTPAIDYVLNCQGCHRSDGAETPGAVPALAGSVARFLTVPGGREYLAQVPGVAQSPLDDAALAAVLNWVLKRFDAASVPADFTLYTEGEVGLLRRKPLVEVDRVRRGLLASARVR